MINVKICIVGPSGAGKSTVLSKLSKDLNISVYSFDEIYWNLHENEFLKNSDEYIASAIDDIIAKDSWIIEGAYDKRLYPFLEKSSLILKMEIPFYIRVFRLFKRYIISTVTKKKPRETLLNTLHLIRFSYTFDKRLSRFLLNDSILSTKVVVFKNYSSCINIIKKMNLR